MYVNIIPHNPTLANTPQLKDQGMINNGISADLNEIQEFCVYIHFVWCSLFEMTLCIAVLFQV